MERIPKIEKKELKKISKIHFLINPGFISDVRDEDKGYEGLFGLYFDKAATIGRDELMFAFTHVSRSEMKEDVGANKAYVEALEKLKKILDDRLIVISSDDNILNTRGAHAALGKIKRIAAARGYYFDTDDVLSEAYGELLGACVDRGAKNLHIVGGLRKKTVVKSKLTDAVAFPDMPTLYEIKRNKIDDRLDVE